ncbi:SGNH/GDSL hydrolase family protein [Streptosporangium sp. NPDC048865]|uniref:SGNH/GDSL hydrolase family protein n=1 Tax=Streptosporangium sp. NPDC048865 TaxID=3155766 RepID=UPI003423A880
MSKRHALRIALVLAATLGWTLVPAAPATSDTAAPPSSMSGLGDSITRGFNACGWFADCTARSWSTGSSTSVDSHRNRIRTQNPDLTAYNDARSGAKIADLAGQARTAASRNVDYVTILMGANDACASSEASMTSVADFESRFRAAMQELAAGIPQASVFVASIPDLKRLWSVGKDSSSARTAWAAFDICRSMLASPRSTSAEDEARRDRVRQRVVDFNDALARVCAEYSTCRYDGGAVFAYPFTLGQLSTWDYFHPSTSGQRALAEVTYPVSQPGSPPVPAL